MTGQKQFGDIGEELAAKHLAGNDYTILHRKWKFLKWEIDIIATKNDVLHFVEVKSLRSKEHPELKVNRKKFMDLCKAANEFLYLHPEYNDVQFDIVSVNFYGKRVEFFLIEDVYF